MILSTSIINPSKKRFKKTVISYTQITIFFFILSRIYEAFSFGESSVHMHYLFTVPLVGGILLTVFLKVFPQFSRMSLNLWNSAVAILTTGTLFLGIVNLSGRSTTLDALYWYVGIGFVILTLLSIVINPIRIKKKGRTVEV
ncbi:hypothetical protein [Streptococcus sp. Marseille-Q0941]|uniref:hypothetical protein n=1 Tax=Streptococcus sp. Marseille-Q0941 TaxID=2942206 RepID=UPI0020738CFC|nr:hypothetical protein [Streptococcus sp. Marseille-Q0941]